MSLAALFRRNPHRQVAARLYADLVQEARRPAYYRDLGVPDSLDGRFEMVSLMAFLVMRRLKTVPEAAGVAQRLFDHMFDDMDRSLREIGVSDVTIGNRIKEMARGFYGRVAAYDAGLAGSDAELGQALRRNLYGTITPQPSTIEAMVAHLRRLDRHLAAADAATLAAGGPVPWLAFSSESLP